MTADTALLVQSALWAGQHALPLFFVMLALLLLAVVACWRTALRHTVVTGEGRIFPAFPVGRRIAAGMAILLVGAGIFAGLAVLLGAGEELVRADQALTDAVRVSVPGPALRVFAALTRLGDTATLTGLCIAIALVLVASGRRGLAAGWVAAVAGNGLLNQTLKLIFGRLRPSQPDGFALVQGFSFPSGHSSGSVVAYGMLAYLALRLLPARWHLPALLAAVALAFAVGASRLFLRVHFASDVIAGFASGTAWLAVCITGIELSRWRHRRVA